MHPKLNQLQSQIYHDISPREALHANLDKLMGQLDAGAPGAETLLTNVDEPDLPVLRQTLSYWNEKHRCPHCLGTGEIEPTDTKGETNDEPNNTDSTNTADNGHRSV